MIKVVNNKGKRKDKEKFSKSKATPSVLQYLRSPLETKEAVVNGSKNFVHKNDVASSTHRANFLFFSLARLPIQPDTFSFSSFSSFLPWKRKFIKQCGKRKPADDNNDGCGVR